MGCLVGLAPRLRVMALVGVAIGWLPLAPAVYAQEPGPLAIERAVPRVGAEPAWLIAHRSLAVQLADVTGTRVNVPILALYDAGGHADVAHRATDVAERLTLAWTLMQNLACVSECLQILPDRAVVDGVQVLDDNRAELFLPGYRPLTSGIGPRLGLFLIDGDGRRLLRILSVYPADVAGYAARDTGEPWESVGVDADVPTVTERSVATYLKAQVEAHFTLFAAGSRSLAAYEGLLSEASAAGKIYKELMFRAREYAGETERPLTRSQLQDTLDRVSVDQRRRLYMLAGTVPRDFLATRR